MPFYAIDWSRYSNHTESRAHTDASNVIDEITRWPTKICKFSGAWLGYKTTKKFRIFSYVHKICLCVVIFAIFASAVISLKYWPFLPPEILNWRHARAVTLTVCLLQSGVCAGSLCAWQCAKRFKTFARFLNAATVGVGLLKRKEYFNRAHNIILVFFIIFPVCFAAFTTVGVFLPHLLILDKRDDDEGTIFHPWTDLFWSEKLNPLTLILIFYACVNWYLAHVFTCDYYGILLAETDSFNDDLRTETNLYQVAVLKHYVLIYHRLSQLSRYANGTHGILLTFTLASNFVVLILYILLFLTRADRLHLHDIIFGAASAVFSLLHNLLFIAMALLLHKKGRYFCDVLSDVVALDWHLDNDYYSVATCYAAHLKRHAIGMQFGFCFLITWRSVAMVVVSTAVITTWIAFGLAPAA